MKTLEEKKLELINLQKKYREMMAKNDLSQHESLKGTELVLKIQRLEADISKAEKNPLLLQAESIRGGLASETEIGNLRADLKVFSNEIFPKYKKAFFPASLNNPVAFEMQRAESKTLLSGLIDRSSIDGITKLFDEVRQSLIFGRVDFASFMVAGIEDFFKSQNIFTGSAFSDFERLKFQFLNENNRLELQQKFEDYQSASEILTDYEYKNSIMGAR